jgi:hypothetical protein
LPSLNKSLFHKNLSLFIPSSLLSIASWIRFKGAKSWIIDFNYPPLDLGLVAIFLFIIGALWLSIFTYKRFKNNTSISIKESALLLLPLLLSPPSTTNDLQVYLYHGQFINQNLDPYSDLSTEVRSTNPYFERVTDQYKSIKSKYGPLWIGISAQIAKLNSDWNIWIFKILNYLFVLVLLIHVRNYSARNKWLWISTLPAIEFIGQGHNDLLSIVICYFLLESKSLNGGLKNGLVALLIPLTKMLYFPFMALNLAKLFQASKKEFSISLSVQILGLAIWYFSHPASLFGSFTTGVSMRPSGTWADIVYELGKVVYDSNIGFKNISLLFELIGLGIFCVYAYKSYRLGSIKIESTLMFGTLVYFSLFIPRLFPWYYAFMVLFFNAFNKQQQTYFFTASFFAVCQGSTHFLNPSTPILPAVIIGLSTFLALIYLSLIVRIEYKKLTSPI